MTSTASRSDAALHDAIIDELTWSPEVNEERIGVAVTDGAVTLAGEVHTLPEKDAAVAAALRVRGVTAVADEIVVDAGPHAVRPDADIARDIMRALAANVSLPPGAVKADVRDHRVTLTGRVPWQYQRDVALQAVTAVPGVNGVFNLLELSPPHPIADAARAKSKITNALVRNAQIDAQHINVAVSGNKIMLSGEVSSWAERCQAERAAWATPGVTHVDNAIKVHDTSARRPI